MSYPADLIGFMNIKPNRSPDSALASIAQSQYGLITRRQALDAGLSKEAILRRVRTGRLVVMSRNVYRLMGAPSSWEQKLLAAFLSLGPGAVVSGRSAAILYGLLHRSDIVELSIPNTRKVKTPVGWIVHRVKDLPPQDVVRFGPFLVTSPQRTMIDIAGLVSPDVLDSALDTGHQKGIVRIARLAFRLRTMNRQGRPGIGVLAQLVDERFHSGREVDSVLEKRLLQLLKDWGFPLPVAQYPVKLGNGKTAYLDFAYPERKLAIECDGFGSHGYKDSFEKDRERDRFLAVASWTTIRLTRTSLSKKQDDVRETLRRLLFD